MNSNEPQTTPSEEAMSDPAHPVTRSTDEARAGETPHIVRYVLGISLALVVVVFAIAAAAYL